MRNKLVLLFLMFCCFSVPVFASSLTCSGTHVGEYMHILWNGKIECYNNLTEVVYDDALGVIKFNSSNAGRRTMGLNGFISGEMVLKECTSLEMAELIKKYGGTDGGTDGGTEVPPLLAPNVGQSLSTENVLSAILPLVPIILAFLVLCWSFYKGYSMLLRFLGQA